MLYVLLGVGGNCNTFLCATRSGLAWQPLYNFHRICTCIDWCFHMLWSFHINATMAGFLWLRFYFEIMNNCMLALGEWLYAHNSWLLSTWFTRRLANPIGNKVSFPEWSPNKCITILLGIHFTAMIINWRPKSQSQVRKKVNLTD